MIKIKKLFEDSMAAGGRPAFRRNFAAMIGVHPGGPTGSRFEQDHREVDYTRIDHQDLLQDLLGHRWKKTFEQFWQEGTQARFEGGVGGGAVMTGDIPLVSAAIDTIAGLWNARALERAVGPKWIWDRMCTVQPAMGEGGWDTGTRAVGDPTNQDGTDLAANQAPPAMQLVAERVHRNRMKRNERDIKLNYLAVLYDTTSTIYQSVDDAAEFVLFERERKVADASMGIAGGPDGTIQMTKDGLTFYPFQTAPVLTPSPENNRQIQNFANCINGSGTGTGGLNNYTVIARSMGTLLNNRDPFTGFPVEMPTSLTWLVANEAAAIQAEAIKHALSVYQSGHTPIQTADGKMTNIANPFASHQYEIVYSQVWANRLVDLGVGAGGMANTITELGYATAGNVQSFFMIGDFKGALIYWQRRPYRVYQAPITGEQLATQTILWQFMGEDGSVYWRNPRGVYREYA